MSSSLTWRGVRRFPAFGLGLAIVASLLLTVPVAAAVDGDEPDTAIEIATADFGTAQAYDTSEATANELADPTTCETEFGGVPGPYPETFWHTFTPAEDGELIVDVNSFVDPESDGYLAVLFIFEDDDEGGLVQVGCNAFPATVRFEAAAGTTYYAMTGSLPETPGGGPTEITVLEPFVSGLTVDGADYDPQTDLITVHGMVVCDEPVFLDVFADASQRIGRHRVVGGGGASFEGCEGPFAWSIVLEGFTSFFNPGSIDLGVNVFACTTVCVGDLLQVTVNARPISNKPAPPSEPPPPPEPPANDEREGAFPISLDTYAEQDASGATTNATDPAECPDAPGVTAHSTVWYTYTAEADGLVDVWTFGSDYDTVLFVLDGDSIVACNDNAPFDTGGPSLLQIAAIAGTTYHIMVGAHQDWAPGFLAVGVFEGFEPPPPPDPPANDALEDAIALAIGETLTADTRGATVDLETDPQECPFAAFPPSEHTVWYTVTPDSDGWVEVDTFDSDFDTTLFVLEDGDVIACNDDTDGLSSRATFLADAGVTYEVMTGSFAGSPGGALVITAKEGVAPLVLEATVDATGSVDTRTGTATISGTVACGIPGTASVYLSVVQDGGRFVAVGGGFAEIACGADPVSWSIPVTGDTSKYQRGSADVFVDVFAESEDGQSDSAAHEAVVDLRPSGRAV